MRFGKVFMFSFAAIFVYLAKPLIDTLTVSNYSFTELTKQLWVIAQVATISGLMGALEKYIQWVEDPSIQ